MADKDANFSTKQLLMTLVLAVLIYFVWHLFFSDKTDSDQNVETDNSEVNEVVPGQSESVGADKNVANNDSSIAEPETTTGSGPNISYEPSLDGVGDPGEVVWTWVSYDDDPSQGKDRPVLIIARDGDDVLGLQLTSTNRASSGEVVEWDGRFYYDLGTGDWDSQGRPSEVLLNRLIVIDPDEIRREGAILERDRFDEVVAKAAAVNGW